MQEQRLHELSKLHNGAQQAYSNGNVVGAQYLACLAGMWTYEWRLPHNPNPFNSFNMDLVRWFNIGYAACEDSIKINQDAREKRLIEDKVLARRQEKEISKKMQSELRPPASKRYSL